VQGKPLYITLDIDSIDPAFAPGTGTPEVGGFSSYQMLQLLRGLRGLNLVGATWWKSRRRTITATSRRFWRRTWCLRSCRCWR